MHTHVHHSGSGDSTGRRLHFSLWITAAYIVVELAAGLRADSLALLSDAGHNFTDTLALALALFAFRWQVRPPDKRKTFGYHRAGVLAAFVNALALIALSLFIFYESYERFLNPREVQETIMIVIAATGLVVNLAVMKALHADCHDLNVRGAYMHMLGDALSSVGIIVGAVAMQYTGALWVDPLLSILIGALILWSAWDVVRESLDILLEALPRGVRHQDVVAALRDVEGVVDVHDLHAWSLSSTAHALCCHAVIADVPPSASQDILDQMNRTLAERFDIRHTTIQFEHIECAHADEICSGQPVEIGAHQH